MQEPDSKRDPKGLNNEFDIQEVFHILMKDKLIILSLTTLISVVGVIYSLLLPNIYESRALLVPVKSSSSISRALGSYSGLAGLAGINLPSDVNESNSEQAIQKITSLSFFENNILKNIFLPDLMAFKSWKGKENIVTYDKRIYNVEKDTWIRDYSYPQQQIPSAQESFKAFTTKHLSLSEDKNTGFITLSIKHQSPFIAKQWVELVVSEVNAFYRQKDKSESEKAVEYLNQQILMTDLSEIKEVIAQLLQEETKKLTLIEANESYVFDYIDPPAVMEVKTEPKRFLICIISAILGVMLSIALVLIRHYFSKEDVV